MGTYFIFTVQLSHENFFFFLIQRILKGKQKIQFREFRAEKHY